MKEDKKVTLKITLSEACEIITERTGEKVTPETHWIQATMEMTRDCPPYAVVNLIATRRE